MNLLTITSFCFLPVLAGQMFLPPLLGRPHGHTEHCVLHVQNVFYHLDPANVGIVVVKRSSKGKFKAQINNRQYNRL